MRPALLLVFLMVGIAGGKASPKVCESFIERIAHEEGIPVKLLKSITCVESGFHAWSLNVEGKSHVFATRQAAEVYLTAVIQKGITNVDIGCTQINWHWHGHQFRSPQELLSPETSLRYAARLLKRHGHRTRSWMKAALLYHSSVKGRQKVYRQRLIASLTHRRPT